MNCIELKKENIGKGYLVLINPDNLLKQVMSNLVSFSDEYKKIKLEKKVSEQLELALNEIRSMEIDLVILQSRSPTCAVKNIYDGSFTGKLIKGQGLFAQALIEAGYKVLDSEDF